MDHANWRHMMRDDKSMQILPGTPYDLIMNWRELRLVCSLCGNIGRVKYLKEDTPICQYCVTGNQTAHQREEKVTYTAKVFFDERQNVTGNNSFSPSAEKPAKVVESWKKLDIPFEIRSFAPLTIDEICLAHDRDFVESVLTLEAPNGYGNCNPEVADALPWVCGSMIASALHSYRTKELSFSPTSGAHHACYAHGMCYCTFNFLAIAAIRAHQEGATRIGILDLDNHHGNGTENIITRLGIDYVRHYSFGNQHLRRGEPIKEWLGQLPDIVRRFDGIDLLIVNAGVDPHISDPLGGLITTRQMAMRDSIVFRVAADMNLPVSVSLAGGYQVDEHGNIDAVLKLHDTMFKMATAAFGADK
jgi:acetoin utilization deacetylase AcuC-like enzyme